MTKRYVKIGVICEAKDGSFYLKFDRDLNFTVNGAKPDNKTISLEDKDSYQKYMVSEGKMTESEAEEQIAKMPKTLKKRLRGKFGGEYLTLGSFMATKDESRRFVSLNPKLKISINGSEYSGTLSAFSEDKEGKEYIKYSISATFND